MKRIIKRTTNCGYNYFLKQDIIFAYIYGQKKGARSKGLKDIIKILFLIFTSFFVQAKYVVMIKTEVFIREDTKFEMY